MTYAQALAELQQRSIDALKVATNVQLSSIEATREITRTLSTPVPITAAFGSITSATTAFTFALLEQQLTYAQDVADTFARKPLAESAHAAVEPAAANPLAVVESAEALAVVEPAEPPVIVEPAEPLAIAAPEPDVPPIAVEPQAVAAATLDDLRDERQRDIEVLSKTLPAPSGTSPAPAPRASGFAAKSRTAPSVSNAKQPKRGPGKT